MSLRVDPDKAHAWPAVVSPTAWSLEGAFNLVLLVCVRLCVIYYNYIRNTYT